MKEPKGLRDAPCSDCGAKIGEPCRVKGDPTGKLAGRDHAGRYKNLDTMREVWAKRKRWHGAPAT